MITSQLSESDRILYDFVCKQLGKESGDEWARIVISRQDKMEKLKGTNNDAI